MFEMLAGITLFVLFYYFGTRGVYVLTRRFEGQAWRRGALSLSFAILFAPAPLPLGNQGGWAPGPAWLMVPELVTRGLWVELSILAGWVFTVSITLFAAASLITKITRRRKVDHESQAADVD